jgi:hypothetical protein
VKYTSTGVTSPTSPATVYGVIAGGLVLFAPIVLEASGNVLNPMDPLAGATVRVTYDGMRPGDLIGLSWDGKDNLTPPQPGSASGFVDFPIPESAVAVDIGKTVPVIYAVVRNGVPTLSDTLNLTVLTLPAGELEAPKITQAPNDTLDVGALTGDADLTVKPWPFCRGAADFPALRRHPGRWQRLWLAPSNLAEPADHFTGHAQHHGGVERTAEARGRLSTALDL